MQGISARSRSVLLRRLNNTAAEPIREARRVKFNEIKIDYNPMKLMSAKTNNVKLAKKWHCAFETSISLIFMQNRF